MADKSAGTFQFGARDVLGELTVDDENTSLYVEASENFIADFSSDVIFGTLVRGKKVTLGDCVIPNWLAHSWSQKGGKRYHGEILPNVLLFGDHIDPNDAVIRSVRFRIDDGDKIFHEPGTFGLVSDPREKMRSLLPENEWERIGSNPHIAYFSGKFEIFTCDLEGARFVVHHGLSMSHDFIKGINLGNQIWMQFDFEEARTLEAAMDSVFVISQLFGLLCGRTQGIYEIGVMLDPGTNVFLDVVYPLAHKTEYAESANLNFADVLVRSNSHPEQLAHIIPLWFKQRQIISHARTRFFATFKRPFDYSADRLVALANVFDLIPNDFNVVDRKLRPEVQEAVDRARGLFVALPKSAERDAALGALGRLNGANLKKKATGWSEHLRSRFGGQLAEITFVTNAAVDLRNHFVHGTEPKFDYEANFDQYVFLTDTLEFVFAMGAMFRLGWTEDMWLEHGKGWTHRFGRYLLDYDRNMAELKRVLDRAPSTGARQN